ncbi:formylglycine-generating enzyme family protein [Methylolobus aquaticus]
METTNMWRAVVLLFALGLAASPVWAFLPDEEPAQKATPKSVPKARPKPKPKPAPAPRKPVARKDVTREMNCYTEGSRRICVEEVGGGEPAASARSASGKVIKDCAECPEMIPLPGADIAIGKYEVTRGQFARFINETGHATHSDCEVWTGSVWKQGGSWRSPGFDQTEDHPVVCVDWNDAVAYAAWLSDKTGHDYRLPTEEEWFSACQAGGGDHDYCGSNDVDAVAWYDGNSGNRTHPVGKKEPNARGIYDLSGNVWEWTKDCWEGNCGIRVVRGGSWNDKPGNVRATDRLRNDSGVAGNINGFRLARTLR